MDRNVNIICAPDGKKIVLINDIRFKGKKREEWKEVEEYLKEYIGEFYSKVTPFQHDSGYLSGNDQVLIVVDSAKDYVQKAWTALPDAIQKWNK